MASISRLANSSTDKMLRSKTWAHRHPMASAIPSPGYQAHIYHIHHISSTHSSWKVLEHRKNIGKICFWHSSHSSHSKDRNPRLRTVSRSKACRSRLSTAVSSRPGRCCDVNCTVAPWFLPFMPFISIYVIYARASVLFHRQRILESLRNLLEPRPSSRTFTPRCSPDALKLTSSSLALELFLADLHKRMRWYFTCYVFDVFGSVFARHALEAFRVHSGEMLQDAQWIVEHGHFAVTLLQCLVTKPMQRKVRKVKLDVERTICLS